MFALTSLSEAASITLLEAMASAVPVVATAVGGNPEIVRDDVDGCLVPRGDCAAVAAALLTLLREPALAQKSGGRRRTRIGTTSGSLTRLRDITGSTPAGSQPARAA